MLDRFLDAQKTDYPIALQEIKNGRKTSHWIWYIFPQIEGLGSSDMNKKYSIHSKKEALEYYQHPVLSARLKEITQALSDLHESNPYTIFGNDARKVKSCMTLFYIVSKDRLFKKVLDQYYHGEMDRNTIKRLK